MSEAGSASELPLIIEPNMDLAMALLWLVVGVSFAILLITILLRLRLIRTTYRQKEFLKIWRPIITNATIGIPVKTPPISKNNIRTLLIEWNHLHEQLNGLSLTNLNSFGKKIGLEVYAAQMLLARDQRNRLIGITTLGNLREERAWPILSALAHGKEGILAIASIRAMMKIKKFFAVKEFLGLLIQRNDWPLTSVVKLLKDIDPVFICAELEAQSHKKNTGSLKRTINLMHACRCASISRVITKILSDTDDPTLATLCLKYIRDPRHLGMIESYLTHSDWMLRMAAATAYGNIAHRKNFEKLIPLLSDPEWWVRYRAAQSIVKLPTMSNTDITIILDKLTDRFAIDILKQAQAEWRYTRT